MHAQARSFEINALETSMRSAKCVNPLACVINRLIYSKGTQVVNVLSKRCLDIYGAELPVTTCEDYQGVYGHELSTRSANHLIRTVPKQDTDETRQNEITCTYQIPEIAFQQKGATQAAAVNNARKASELAGIY